MREETSTRSIKATRGTSELLSVDMGSVWNVRELVSLALFSIISWCVSLLILPPKKRRVRKLTLQQG